MSDKSRRKLLKSIAAGSGAVVAGKSLPENWTKPVVDSVLLPTHAQTSPCTSCLVAATYCEGSGTGSITATVTVNGTVTVVHPRGTGTGSVDSCTGGDFSVTIPATPLVITGNIPCGTTNTINIQVNGGTPIPLLQNLCPV